MLVSTRLAKVSSVDRLIKVWANRYVPDVLSLPLRQDPSLRSALITAASPEGRAATAAKLHEKLLDKNCKYAISQSRDLYADLQKILDLREALRLSQFALQIYIQLLKLYQELPSIEHPSTEQFWSHINSSPASAWGLPKVEKLADALEPVLLKYQEQYVLSKDWRMLGFITTQLNIANELSLKELTPVEQVLIQPYFNFVEEQVALPWQRVCAAAEKHDVSSPAFLLVERMLPMSSDIAATVYRRLAETFPTHRSRRGTLSHAGVKHSCLRDLNMFQAYLWLCVLQETMEPIEQELAALCIMVMESVGVKWEVTARWCELLVDEILNRVPPEHKSLLLPYGEDMVEAFYNRRSRFGG